MSHPGAGPALRVLEGGGPALSSLLEEWDGLHRAHPTSSPFQSAGWVGAYCGSYRADDVVTVALRQGDRLEAAAVFRRDRRGAARVLTSAPPHVSDFHDVVLGRGEGPPSRLVEGLLSTPGWDVLDFREVPASADLWRVVASWPGRVLRFPASECVVMDGRDLADFSAGLPRPKRKQLGQQQRGIARAGVTFKPAEGDPEAAVRTMLELHQRSWSGRAMNPEHATARFRDLLVEAVSRLAPRRRAVVMEFHQHGRVRGSALYLAGPRYVGVYLTGHHPDLREQVNLHVLENVAGFELVADLGLGQLNLLRGAEDYKRRVPTGLERNQRVVLLRPGSPAGRAVGLGISARRGAATVVRGGRRRLAAWRAARRSA